MKRIHAFTITELLVAVAVLALLVVLTVQLTNRAVSTVSVSNKGMNALSQSRLVLDRLAQDLGSMVVRPDVDYTFDKLSGNDELAFYSRVPGLFSTGSAPQFPRTLSVAGYRVAVDARRRPQLQRGARGLDWPEMVFSPVVNGRQVSILKTPNSLPPVDPAGVSPSNYQVLAEHVFRFELSFVINRNPTTGEVQSPEISASVPSSLSDLAAVILGVAVLDGQSGAIVNDYAPLIGSLPDAVDGQDIVSLWSPIVEKSDFAAVAQVPRLAAQSVRVFQQYYYLK